MNKSPPSRSSLSSRNLIVKPSVEEEAARAAFLALPQLIVDHSNLAATTKALADRFAIAGGLFEQGPRVVKIVPTLGGDRVERLNADGVVLEPSFKAPIFIALDDTKKTRTREARTGLKSKATWQIEIPFGHPELGKTALASHDPRSNFIERVKQEIAEFTGVDVGKVVLEIRIVA